VHFIVPPALFFGTAYVLGYKQVSARFQSWILDSATSAGCVFLSQEGYFSLCLNFSGLDHLIFYLCAVFAERERESRLNLPLLDTIKPKLANANYGDDARRQEVLALSEIPIIARSYIYSV
jgi:hypothetical protein